MADLFDFLRWVLSDFWRICGLAVLIFACGSIVPSFRSERKVVNSAEVTTTKVAK